ncbi:MAG TPA: hypothetical protein VMU89_01580 [Thermomicrobiaceae bacterium]|nr:hypothetical protein [Thermomicrobiaceae bacterium]
MFQRLIRSNGWRFIVLAAAVAAVFGAGSALVALGDPAPVTYYACLKQGNLTKVGTSAPAHCPDQATVASWNQVGPMGPIGSQGVTGPQGPGGPSGPQGPVGPQESMGASGVVGVQAVDGPVGYVVHGQTSLGFVGPQVIVTVGAGQRIVASIGADLGALNPASNVAVGLCYQELSGGVISLFYLDVQYLDVSGRTNQEVSATVTPGAGTYAVGYCIQDASPDHDLDLNGSMAGWVMITGSRRAHRHGRPDATPRPRSTRRGARHSRFTCSRAILDCSMTCQASSTPCQPSTSVCFGSSSL